MVSRKYAGKSTSSCLFAVIEPSHNHGSIIKIRVINIMSMRLRIICISMVFLGAVFALEPVYRNKTIFALPFMTNSKITVEQTTIAHQIQEAGPVQEKSRAP